MIKIAYTNKPKHCNNLKDERKIKHENIATDISYAIEYYNSKYYRYSRKWKYCKNYVIISKIIMLTES